MTLKEILEEKEARYQSVPDELLNGAEKAQKKALNELIRQLDLLARDENGNIAITETNINQINSIAENVRRVIFEGDSYNMALVAFAKEFSTQAGLTNQYFETLDRFEANVIYQTNLQQSIRNSVELLGVASIDSVFINPLKQILLSSITTGQGFGDALNTLRTFVDGDKERMGTMSRYVKQVAYDAFAIADRNYMQLISDDLNYEFFEFQGGLLKDSRYFCAKRHGQIFHKKEIELWGAKPDYWNAPVGSPYHGGGRIPATDSNTIFSFVGGYNCQHQFAPVLIESVPKSVIDNAIAKGWYKP